MEDEHNDECQCWQCFYDIEDSVHAEMEYQQGRD